MRTLYLVSRNLFFSMLFAGYLWGLYDAIAVKEVRGVLRFCGRVGYIMMTPSELFTNEQDANEEEFKLLNQARITGPESPNQIQNHKAEAKQHVGTTQWLNLQCLKSPDFQVPMLERSCNPCLTGPVWAHIQCMLAPFMCNSRLSKGQPVFYGRLRHFHPKCR